MRILLKLLAATACAWALPVHGQAHTNPPPPAPASHSATHAPVSAMGRAMAALLDQAARTQPNPSRTQATAASAGAVVIDTRSATASQDVRIADDASPGQDEVH